MSKDIDGNNFIIDDNAEVVEKKEKKPSKLFGKKKTKYVPDAEIMEYIKEKKADEATVSSETTELPQAEEHIAEVVAATDDVSETPMESEPIIEEQSTENESTETISDTAKEKKAFDIKNALLKVGNFFIPKKDDSKKQIIIKIVSIVAALTLICSACYLSYYFIDLGQQDAKIDNVRNMYELNRDDYTVNNDGQFSKFDTLKAQNSDIVGWINIANTKIDNPVYQTNDNDYYITHDMNKEYNSYGALFLDYRCKFNPLSPTQNLIIYGHNMRYGAMFGTLNDYRKLDFYKSSPVISYDTLYEQKKYKIFAMMIVNTTEDDTFGYSFSAYRPSFTSQEEFMQWIQYCKDRSLIDTPGDVETCDEIITLSTCCYDFEEARFVVMGRLIREGEDEKVDTSTAVMNDDVIYSKEWYNKKRIPIPTLNKTQEEK